MGVDRRLRIKPLKDATRQEQLAAVATNYCFSTQAYEEHLQKLRDPLVRRGLPEICHQHISAEVCDPAAHGCVYVTLEERTAEHTGVVG